ncbi:MAG: hypothetical protein ACJA0N_002616 [Pseudohongiellaceae bacterium]|jgi:hypothetical protein
MTLLLSCLQSCGLDNAGGMGAVSNQTVYKSTATKGAGIKLEIESPELIGEGLESILALKFYLNPNETLSLTFVVNDTIQFFIADGEGQSLRVDGEKKLQADMNGKANLQLSFIPHEMGKFYLKIFSSVERQGNVIPQVFSVPIYVGDETGMTILHKKEHSKQVVLPASRY